MILVCRRFRQIAWVLAVLLWSAALIALIMSSQSRWWEHDHVVFKAAILVGLFTGAQTMTIVAVFTHITSLIRNLLHVVYQIGAYDGSGGQIEPVRWHRAQKEDVMAGMSSD